MSPKYFNESEFEVCLSTLSELKTQVKTGLDANEALERSKLLLLDLIDHKIPIKMIVKHFHNHNIKIPYSRISAYIKTIRPKSTAKRKPPVKKVDGVQP